ncbi:hypothetical protein AAAV41_00310, partial [Hominiventricola filiformis]|nr:hypothetical protein [Hominiventricola filiformis]
RVPPYSLLLYMNSLRIRCQLYLYNIMQSAPWYTELLLDGAMVAVVVVVCIVLKLVIWRKLKP